MNQCKTCKHFRPGITPLNAQLGLCAYLEITDNEPCGYTIEHFNFHGSEREPTTRLMDDFGCIYHEAKHVEITNQTQLDKPPVPVTPTDFYGDAITARLKELNAIDFKPTFLTEFSAGYSAAIDAIRHNGTQRVFANDESGIPE